MMRQVATGPYPSILLIGRNGQLGWELRRTLAPLGRVVAPERDSLDLEKAEAIRIWIEEIAPDLIVNAAAYTDVDGAEDAPERAFAANAEAPGILAEEAKRSGIPLVHYSTDYVFGGRAGQDANPYKEDDTTNPVNVYGRSKLAGEEAIRAVGPNHLILRSSWVYGNRRKNFLKTVQRLAREGNPLRMVNDEFGSPTWARMIAETTAQVLARTGAEALGERGGVFHCAAVGVVSRHAFAAAILAHGMDCDGATETPELHAIGSGEFATRARRPAFSGLDSTKIANAFGIVAPSWEQQLELCLEN